MTDEANKALLTECFENLKITPDCQESFKKSDDNYRFSSTCSEKPNSSVMNLDLNSSDKPLTTDNLMCLQSEQYFDSLKISLSKCSKKTIQECKYNYINIDYHFSYFLSIFMPMFHHCMLKHGKQQTCKHFLTLYAGVLKYFFYR